MGQIKNIKLHIVTDIKTQSIFIQLSMNLNLVASSLLEKVTESILEVRGQQRCDDKDSIGEESTHSMNNKLRSLLSNEHRHQQLVCRLKESGIFETGDLIERLKTVEKGKLRKVLTTRIEEVSDESQEIGKTNDETMGKMMAT